MLTNQFVLYFDSPYSCFFHTSGTSQNFLIMPNSVIAAFYSASMWEFS